MAKTATKAKKPSRSFTDGYAYEFHGSFKSKFKAQTKARAVDGWVISRFVGRGLRYIVQTKRAGNVPF